MCILYFIFELWRGALLLKYGFCKESFRKDATLNS